MKIGYALVMGSMMAALAGCAHGDLDKRVDEKLAQETGVKTRADIGTQAQQSIDKEAGLTQDQRAKLGALRESMRTQMASYTDQSLRLRSLLVQDVISANYDEDEVQLIKSRIRKVEERRVSAIFDAVDQANQILGRDAGKNRHVIENMFEVPHGLND